MAEEYSKEVLKICVGQISQVIGWTAIQSTPLETITDIVAEYIKVIARRAHNYAELYNQTEPNLNHIDLAFKDLGISISALEDYVKNFDNPLPVLEIPKFPVPRESHLNFLKPGSREVLTRPVHIHEHLPPMHPHLEDSNYSIRHSPSGGEGGGSAENTSPLSSPKGGVFKRPGDPLTDGLMNKRYRAMLEEESRPLREISSVMMTTSGFLSPAREGKLPEARTPSTSVENLVTLTPEPVENPPNPEPKEKKKRKSAFDSSLTKKIDKENKVKDEVAEVKDEPKVKKLASMKETSKLKALKSGAIKLMSQHSTGANHQSIGSLPKIPKLSTPKSKPPPAAPVQEFLNTPKSTKNHSSQHSQKSDSNSQLSYSFGRSDHLSFPPDEKLPSEPDKQKLNIFRKISKVKEDLPVEVPTIKKELVEVEEPPQLSQVDQTIESVIKEARVVVKEELEIKEEHIDVEGIDSPPHFDSLSLDGHSIPGTPTTPRTPDLPRVTEHKKKKKEKHKEKRDTKDRHNHSPKMVSKYMPDPEFILAKPKTPEVDLTPDEPTPNPVFPFFPHFPPGPGLIPSPIAHSLLFQHLPLPLTKHNPLSNSIAPSTNSNSATTTTTTIEASHQEPVASPNVASAPSNSNNSVSPPQFKSQTPVSKASEPPPAKKKDHKKDKKIKEKIKKKKEKKAKSKDKSEKKKIKLEKKEREKEKSKLKKEKKEKKKDKEKQLQKQSMNCSQTSEENSEVPSGGLPKITLKFGPVSPQDPQDGGVRKIVIKPLLKKEEEAPTKTERVPSPELARISPLVPRPSKHKSRNYSATNNEEGNKPSQSSNQTIPVSSEKKEAPIAVRLDNDGNEVWICPACGRQDDGSPMIGCDGCDAWYHWVCVGIQVPPDSSEWFCRLCVTRKSQELMDKKKKNRKKKPQH